MSDSLVIFLLLAGFVGFVALAVYSFFSDDTTVGATERTGYRYNFDEHQNYWNEDK